MKPQLADWLNITKKVHKSLLSNPRKCFKSSRYSGDLFIFMQKGFKRGGFRMI